MTFRSRLDGATWLSSLSSAVTRSWFSLEEARRVFDGAPFQWWVAGGRALDLFVSHELRLHNDADVAVLRPDQSAVRHHLKDWDSHVVVAPENLAAWTTELAPSQHAVSCRESADAPWAFELLFNDVDHDTWLFRRDHAIRMPLARIGRNAGDATPYLAPEIVLLYKAKQVRSRDAEDFAAVEPRLSDHARTWLREAIERAHPGHPWLTFLA